MTIDLNTPTFLLIVSYMSLFASSIASGACNEFIGVNFTTFLKLAD